jgi:7-carboxy-7-deazaguanine synthase
MTLTVCELFKSIQGESTRAGMVCTFVRLGGCNLSCAYCDTRYAQSGGEPLSVEQVMARVSALGCTTVEITGGEPLLQAGTPPLCMRLLEEGCTVMVETNGSLPIDTLPPGCIRIVDIKSPGSGEQNSFRHENLAALRPSDECKFVLTDRRDFDWAIDYVRTHRLCDTCPVLFSPATGRLAPDDLAAWILAADQPVRLGLQLHKIIWGEKSRM